MIKVVNTNNEIMKKPQINIEKFKKDYLKMRLDKQRKELIEEFKKMIDEQPDTTGYGDIHRVMLKIHLHELKSKEKK